MYVVVGLGNPGEEYENTRHNTGRLAVLHFLKKNDLPTPVFNKKYQSLVSEGKIGKEKIFSLLPETFMNKSGAAVSPAIGNKKKAENLIVVHDDLDLPLGRVKVSFNRGPAGHRGLLSIIKSLKTEAFIRIKIGISPTVAGGKMKKPIGDIKVDKHILGKFSPKEELVLKKIFKTVSDAIYTIATDGRERAMSAFNAK